jgi:hypothetical protein
MLESRPVELSVSKYLKSLSFSQKSLFLTKLLTKHTSTQSIPAYCTCVSTLPLPRSALPPSPRYHIPKRLLSGIHNVLLSTQPGTELNNIHFLYDALQLNQTVQLTYSRLILHVSVVSPRIAGPALIMYLVKKKICAAWDTAKTGLGRYGMVSWYSTPLLPCRKSYRSFICTSSTPFFFYLLIDKTNLSLSEKKKTILRKYSSALDFTRGMPR